MSFRERLAELLEPKEVGEAREIDLQRAAFAEEGRATVAFLQGKISLDEYQQTCDRLFPLVKLDLRRLAHDVRQ